MMERQHQANQCVVGGLWFTHGLSVATFLLACLTMISGMLAQEPPVSQRKVLRLGFTDYPPFAYQEDGEFRGFDIEYIQAIAKETGKPRWVPQWKWSNSKRFPNACRVFRMV